MLPPVFRSLQWRTGEGQVVTLCDFSTAGMVFGNAGMALLPFCKREAFRIRRASEWTKMPARFIADDLEVWLVRAV